MLQVNTVRVVFKYWQALSLFVQLQALNEMLYLTNEYLLEILFLSMSQIKTPALDVAAAIQFTPNGAHDIVYIIPSLPGDVLI